MHILGIANGSPGGNSEILLKAALTAATEANPSLTISWIHAPSVHVPVNPKPLSSALDISMGTVSSMFSGSSEHREDDRAAVLNAILDADALIFATPVYSHQPPGMLKAVIDRIMGPFTDASMVTRVLDARRCGREEFVDMVVDERVVKPRVVGFIAVAGSTLSDQITMALPTLHQFVYPIHAKVVDQYVFQGYGPPGSVITLHNGEAVQRAQAMGRNVANQIGKAFDDAKYVGPEPEGCCPYCHLSKIDLFCTKDNTIGCLVCGAQGHLSVSEDGVIRPFWRPNSDISSITMAGKQKHLDDIMMGAAQASLSKDGDEEAKAKLQRWIELSIPKVNLPSMSK